MKSEEYWSLLANEIDLLFRECEQMIYESLVNWTYSHVYLHNAFMVIFFHHTYASKLGTCLYTLGHIICTRFSLYEYMMILSEPTVK